VRVEMVGAQESLAGIKHGFEVIRGGARVVLPPEDHSEGLLRGEGVEMVGVR